MGEHKVDFPPSLIYYITQFKGFGKSKCQNQMLLKYKDPPPKKNKNQPSVFNQAYARVYFKVIKKGPSNQNFYHLPVLEDTKCHLI